MKTVVGLFNTTAEAQQIKQTLIADGYQASHINVVANEDEDAGAYASSTSSSSLSGSTSESLAGKAGSTATGVGHKISEFFSSLTGGDEDVHNHYATGVNQGGALLTVTTEDEDAAAVAALLKQSGARDIDSSNQGSATAGTPIYGAGRTGGTTEQLTGETAIPIVEEELVVGKREVDRGGVRVYSHVVERPVSADVTLRDERINVERRAVNRPATVADFGNGETSFELRASGEEAVVGKNSRVVEEVLIGKEGSNRTEAIQDTVRKTEVEVEKIPAEQLTTEKNRF